METRQTNAGADNGRKLDAEDLLFGTAKSLHLTQYIDDSLRARFFRLVSHFNAVDSIPEERYPQAVQQFREAVARRLKLARDWHTQPDILARTIERPLFVVGTMGAGAILLHYLMGLGEAFRVPRLWEIFHPSPPPDSDPFADLMSLEEQNRHIDDMLSVFPDLALPRVMLDEGGMAPANFEEVVALDFHLALPTAYYKVPTMPIRAIDYEPRAAYDFHKKLIKQLLWKADGGYWTCWSVSHLLHLDVLLETYPDATVVWVHCPPENYILTELQLIESIYRALRGKSASTDIREVLQNTVAMVNRGLAFADDERIHHLSYHRLETDPLGAVEQVC